MYRRTGRGRLLLLVFIALSLIIITLDFRQDPGGPLERAKDISVALVAPIQRGFTTVVRPVGNFFSSIGELSSLRSENARLEAENKELLSKESQAQALIDQNSRLTELLGVGVPWLKMRSVTASLVSRSPSNYKWAYYIDRGFADGIRPDMAVVNAQGLVGKTIRVEDHFSLVLLLIDPQGAASARLEGGRDTGLIQGNGGNQPLSLELIGPNAEVVVGERVITAGQDGGIFPPGIPVGTVLEVGTDARATNKDIQVDPAVDFEGLDYVKVLLDTGSNLPTSRGK